MFFNNLSDPHPLTLAVSERGPGLRLRGAILGAALGASIGVPAGLLQDKLVEMLPVDQQLQRRRRIQETETIIAGNGECMNEGKKALSYFQDA